ncbi:MAG: bacteriohemerythrin [Treponema sp.]|nr:bacteriohemerythrin [Treponema sp.]
MKKNKELITWSGKMTCGLSLIDDQHRKLVDLINDLFNHVTGNEAQERKYFDRVKSETLKYIKIHFATEERIMLVTKFEGYTKHKNEHEVFILALLDYVHDYEVGGRLPLSAVLKFLKDWMVTHIVTEDKLFFEYLNKLAGRKTFY